MSTEIFPSLFLSEEFFHVRFLHVSSGGVLFKLQRTRKRQGFKVKLLVRVVVEGQTNIHREMV